MYAVIRSGGKQYRVSPGEVLRVELLPVEPGSAVDLGEALFVAHDGDGAGRFQIGRPTVKGVTVAAEVVRTVKGPKLTVFWKNARLTAMKKRGHRQTYSEIRITRIGDTTWTAPAA